MLSKILNAHLPWVILMIIISIESSMTDISLPDLGISFADKIVHFFVFGVLGWLIARGMDIIKVKNFMIVSLSIGLAFGIIDEWHQSFVPGRDADLYDLIADFSGVFFFVFYYKLKFKK